MTARISDKSAIGLNRACSMAPSQKRKMERIEGMPAVFTSTVRENFTKNGLSFTVGEDRIIFVQSARFAGWFYLVRWTRDGIDECTCGKPNGCVHTRAACAFTAQRHAIAQGRAEQEMLAGMKGIADRMRAGLAEPYSREEIDQEAQLAAWTAEELVEVA